MVVVIEFLTNWIYNNEQDLSFEEKEKEKKVESVLIKELVINPFFIKEIENEEKDVKILDEISKLIENKDDKILNLLTNWHKKTTELQKTSNTQFIIEEPEQNLFPEAQRDLVYYLLGKCKDEAREHRLTLTTHSPYILYALNNCMMGYLVKDKMPKTEQVELLSNSAWIDPKTVSIWEIEEGKGTIKCIQEEDGLIGNNYFDASMKKVMDDFYAMLNYYGDEK